LTIRERCLGGAEERREKRKGGGVPALWSKRLRSTQGRGGLTRGSNTRPRKKKGGQDLGKKSLFSHGTQEKRKKTGKGGGKEIEQGK